MLFVITISWKPEKDEEIHKRFTERRIPRSKELEVKGYYHLLNKHKAIGIAEAPDETTIAKSAINWADLAEVEYIPAMEASEYFKLRKELLK